MSNLSFCWWLNAIICFPLHNSSSKQKIPGSFFVVFRFVFWNSKSSLHFAPIFVMLMGTSENVPTFIKCYGRTKMFVSSLFSVLRSLHSETDFHKQWNMIPICSSFIKHALVRVYKHRALRSSPFTPDSRQFIEHLVVYHILPSTSTINICNFTLCSSTMKNHCQSIRRKMSTSNRTN